MLTHDTQHTTHDDGRKQIAIGNLSNSDDLKSEVKVKGKVKKMLMQLHSSHQYLTAYEV